MIKNNSSNGLKNLFISQLLGHLTHQVFTSNCSQICLFTPFTKNLLSKESLNESRFQNANFQSLQEGNVQQLSVYCLLLTEGIFVNKSQLFVYNFPMKCRCHRKRATSHHDFFICICASSFILTIRKTVSKQTRIS